MVTEEVAAQLLHHMITQLVIRQLSVASLLLDASKPGEGFSARIKWCDLNASLPEGFLLWHNVLPVHLSAHCIQPKPPFGSPESLGQGRLVHRRGGFHGLVHGSSQRCSLLGIAGLPGGCPLACTGQDLGSLKLLHHFWQQPGWVAHPCSMGSIGGLL